MSIRRNLLKYGVLISTAYAIVMLFHWKPGFTFFTQLSNLYAAGVVALQLIAFHAKRDGNQLRLWKYSATVSIFVTFLVYLTVLAPLTPGGMLAAYRQDHWASLCLHIVTPALVVCDFFLYDAPRRAWRARDAAYAMVPPMLYYVFILTLGLNGYRWGKYRMAAPYMFLNYDSPAGWFGFMPQTARYTTAGVGVFYVALLLMAAFWGVSLLLLKLARARSSKP